ncbi:MAG: extracellular solute-binding protein, partial [Lachnospiraceae bacterium]|nr:extracellular solute-binding protein [Lachnospiraceae bacterium]
MSRSKKWLAACLAGVIAASLMGCGSSAGTNETDGQGAGANGESVTGDEDTAMGRYMESVSEVNAGPLMDIVKLSDGRLALLEDGAVGRMVSADNGVTWEEDMLPDWDELMTGDNFVVDMKASPDGSVAILFRCYNFAAAEEQTDEGEQDEAAEEQTEDGEQDEEVHVIGDEYPKRESKIYLISPEGEAEWITLSLAEDENLNAMCFSEDGSRLFTSSYDEKIYEIDQETGTGRLFMTVGILPDMFCVWENYMALKSEVDGVWLYDMDTKEQLVDDVLSDFVTQNCKGRDDMVASIYSIFPAEEGGIYLVCGKGVYRHVIGGTVMEQVINGGLSSLGDPTKHISKMTRTEEKGFIAAFSEGKISAFTYDPNISTIPSQVITAYSLTESTLLRQAIIRYQGKNPDVYVEYKVGMDEEGGITREDAIKKLNTEIMAGKGPDFLLLDDLPIDSYIDKGVLADISPYLDDLEKEEKLLSNIRESFTNDGKTYMIPAAVTLPVYMTDKQYMTNVSDLSTLADMFEELRRTYPGEEIMEVYNDTVLLDVLMPVSEPLWLTKEQQFDVQEVSEYLEQTKRIYDACMEGLSEEVLEKYRAREAREFWIVSSDEMTAYTDLQGGAIQIAAGNVQVSMGDLNNAYNYAL